jgi:thiamine-phosphate pyrophosphorylase
LRSALSGVTADAAPPCLDAGAAAVAVMGEIMRSEQPGRTIGELLKALTSVGKGGHDVSI